MIERTTVRLPAELLRRAKRKAAEEGSTLTALIEEGLRRVVTERPRLTKHLIELPVSRASGGLQPGLGEIDNSALQEADDLDYVARMERDR
jgi:hypothetical protein